MRETLRATLVAGATAAIALAAPPAAAQRDDDLFETPGLYEPHTPYGRSPTEPGETGAFATPEPDDPLGSGPLEEGSDDRYAPDPADDDPDPIDDDPLIGGGNSGTGGLY